VCEQLDAEGETVLRAERLSDEDPGRPVAPPRFGRLRRLGPSSWDFRRAGIRLGFLVGAVILGAAAVIESALRIASGDWNPLATIALVALGVSLGVPQPRASSVARDR